MNIAAVVMPVRVGAYQRLVSGEMLFAKPFAQLLRPFYGQTVVGCVTGVKTDNIMVALYVLPLLVFPIVEIGTHTRYGEILPAAIKGRYAVIITWDKPPVFVQCGLHSKLVMLKG